ncbi:unnamed protein product [Nippostrongylus brasiliensis]|uniref:DUF418 domain-containing protein n=1 Tax=Nippostrongylus brasiliensis TaxID=27835 RepID=A0A0N4XZG7_NIPBR|nr:unnamed protein product [Nippostrongylus brasiliensis]
MALYDMKDLPHLVKPLTLILVIFQMVCVFSPGYRGFGWFPITTTIIEEMGYSAVFVIFQVVNFFYFIVNMFKHFNAWLLLGMIESAFLAVVWLFNAYQWFRARTPTVPPSTAASGRNQANATQPPRFQPNYPAGVNPA